MSKSNLALVVCFLLFIFGLGIWSLLQPDHKTSYFENRTLAQQPAADYASYVNGEYVKAYNSYFSDQFIGRQNWIKSYYTWNQYVPSLYKGNYYITDQKVVIPGLLPGAKPANVTKGMPEIVDFNSYANSEGIKYYYAIVPHKARLLSGLIPTSMPKGYANENYESFARELQNNQISTIDISAWFASTFDFQTLQRFYFQTDHHWNMEGAFLGYQELISELQNDIKDLSDPYEKSQLTTRCTDGKLFVGTYGRQLALTVDNKSEVACQYVPEDGLFERFDVYVGPVVDKNKKKPYEVYGPDLLSDSETAGYATTYTYDLAELNIKNPEGVSNARPLILKDSYFNAMTYLVASHFKETSVIDLRHFDVNNLKQFIEEHNITHVISFHNDMNFIF